MCRPFCCVPAKLSLYVICLLALIAATPTSALSGVVIATEVMFEEQGTKAVVLGSDFGVDPSSPLSFISFVDPSGNSFNYMTVSGSTYLGKGISFTGMGTMDADGNYNVSASINLGGIILQIVGKETIKMNDDGTVTITSDSDKKDKDGNKIGDQHSETRIMFFDEAATSLLTGYSTKKDGSTEPNSDFTCIDDWNKKTKMWDWDCFLKVPGQFNSTIGLTPADGGFGTFTTTVSVPEPTSLILFVIGSLVFYSRRVAPRAD